MPAPKSSFLDKVLGRIGRLDTEGLQTVVQRLARERSFLETLFNTIEDGVLVVDENGRVIYFNQAVTRLLGLQPNAEGQHLNRFSAGSGLGKDLPLRYRRRTARRAARIRGEISATAFLPALRRTAGWRSRSAVRGWR